MSSSQIFLSRLPVIVFFIPELSDIIQKSLKIAQIILRNKKVSKLINH